MTTMDVTTGITLVPTSLGTYILTLPSIILNDAGIIPGKTYVIRDKDGNANSNPITINAGTDPQYFSDGSTTIYITQPFGFVTVVEQSLGVYRIISTSDYPQGSTDQLAEVLNISTGTVVSNLKLQDVDETSPQQYKLFVSAGSLFLNTIESSNPQSNVELLQLTTNQYQSTFSSIAELFTPSTINAAYVSSFSMYTDLMYVSSLTVTEQTVGQITNETGQLSTIVTIAKTVNTLFLSSGYISTGWISSMDGSFGNLNTSNIQTNTLIGTGNTTMNLVIANEISSATATIMNTLASGNISTNMIQIESLHTNPSFISSLYTTDVSSIRANISTIITNNIEVDGRISSGLVYTTTAASVNAISANTMYIGRGDISTFQFSTILSDQSYVNNLIANTINMNTISVGINFLSTLNNIASLRANTISTSAFQASQLNISSLTANQLAISSVSNRIGTISTIQANTLSTGYLSAASAFFSTMSTSFYSTVSSFALVANIEGLSTNVLSTFELNIGAGGFGSTITSTIAVGYIPSTSIGRISTVNVDFISTRFLVMSTISTIVGDSYVVRTSTLRNTVGGPLPNISAGYATIKTICTLNVSLQVPAIPTTNYLSAGLMNVGYLMASTIQGIRGSMSTALLTMPNNNINLLDGNSKAVILASNLNVNNNPITLNPIIPSLYVAGSDNATNSILTSLDGINWTPRTCAIGYVKGIAYSAQQKLWVAVGYGTVATLQTSSDGINWTTRANNFYANTTIGGKSVAYSARQNLWVAIGSANGTTPGIVQTSKDGITWVNRVNSFSITNGDSGLDVAYSPQQNLWVACGYDSKIQWSPDGITWTLATSAVSLYNQGIMYNAQQNIWVSVGTLSQVSSNGKTWTIASITNVPNAIEMAYSPQQNLWVIVIQVSPYIQSTSNIYGSWTNGTFDIPPTQQMHYVVYNPISNLWIAVGFSTNVYTSSNGKNWTKQTVPSGNYVGLATLYTLPEITNLNLNMYLNSTSIVAYDNVVNNIFAYTSTIAFNSTLYIQNNINEVGINTINPAATLDINSTIRAVTGATTISTINVNRISAPIINVDTLSTSARISTRQILFSSLTADSISAGFMFVSTLTADQIFGGKPVSSFNQISSGVYEGGRFAPASLSTIEIGSLNIFTTALNTNTVSTINYLLPKLNVTSSFIMSSGNNNNNYLYTSYNGIDWKPLSNPLVGTADRFTNCIPSYNPYGNFWVFPYTDNISPNFGGIYTYDFKTYSTLNTIDLGAGKFYLASPSIQILFNGTGGYVYKGDQSPVGVWSAVQSVVLNPTNYGVYNGTRFVICGGTSATTTHIMSSENGTTWVARAKPFDGPTGASSVAWNGTRFAACGTAGNGFTTSSIATSVDGLTWLNVNTTILVGFNGSVPVTWIAANNSNWIVTQASTGGTGNITMFIANENLSVWQNCLYSNTNSNIISGNATTGNWMINPGGAYRVAWNPDPGVWFASGSNNSASAPNFNSAYSVDGLRWYPLPTDTPIVRSNFGGIIVTPNFGILWKESTIVTNLTTVNNINTVNISTNTTLSYGDIYADTISTTQISSDYGYFSTVAIGGAFDPAYALNVSGIINATYQVTVNGDALTSDSNVKTNIELADLDKCYNTMESLPLKRFTYLPEYSQGTQDKTQLGFIAQEVQEVFPKSIFSIPSGPSGQDILHLTFDQLFINSYGATQKLMTIVEERQNIISTLYSTVDILQSQVSTLKGNNV